VSASSASETTALAVAPASYEVGQVTDAAALILGPSFDRVQSFAGLMAKGAVSVPKHLRRQLGDRLALTIPALGWRMNPFAVAPKTHLSQSGALGHGAPLVSAVLVSTGAVKGEPDYVPIGDWSKVLGKVEERTGQKRDDGSGGGKYYVATYTKKDEEGLGVIVRATLANGHVRELPVMLSQAYPRFSTQWATDPYQQLCYLAVRKFGRLHTPGAILGVYTTDELDGGTPGEKFMGPADVVGAPPPAPKPDITVWPDDKFAAQLPRWTKAITEGLKTNREIISLAKSKGELTPAQEAQINAIKAPEKADTATGEISMTYAAVADRLATAADSDKLAEAADLIQLVPAESQRKELEVIYTRRVAELNT